MGTQITDEFLIKIVEELSAIRTTTASLQGQMEKIDEKVVEPFQNWLHQVKTHSIDIENLKKEFQGFSTKLTKIEDSVDELERTHGKELVDLNHRIDQAKWYGLGATAAFGLVAMVVYKVFVALIPFFK